MRGTNFSTFTFVLFRRRLSRKVILRHSRRICFFVTRWKSRCFALAQHDIQVICSIVTQSLEGEEMNAVNVANLPETNGKAGLLENYPKIKTVSNHD